MNRGIINSIGSSLDFKSLPYIDGHGPYLTTPNGYEIHRQLITEKCGDLSQKPTNVSIFNQAKSTRNNNATVESGELHDRELWGSRNGSAG